MKIAIVGSGIAGLSAGRALQRGGADVTLFDKSRGVGGRMSTRYAGEWEFDHGAQYFTAQDLDFQREIDAAVQAGAAAPWPAKGLYLEGGKVSSDKGRARYVGVPRMNRLPKYLADGLDIDLGRRVTQVVQSDKWSLGFEDGKIRGSFDGVISTLPPAQARDILPKGFSKTAEVSQAQMHACFALMIGLPHIVDVGWDTLRIKDLPIDWISINSAKPGRSKTSGTILIHSEATWSDKHIDADRDWIQNIMIKCASPLVGLPLEDAPHIALHRWLYASNKTSPDMACLKGDGFVLAGDWCFGGRVEGAWLSGRAAARRFI